MESCFRNHRPRSDFTSGPLRFSTVDPVHMAKEKEFYEYTITNPTNPDDELAINIGNLYMNNNNKFQTEMVIAVEAVFDAQKEKDLQGT
ncbi:unnamed protein product [Adineta steineri]|uniref:Uncharacterized protein n=1 Tax=Adineta steineri TaxID=433720 RepID=A0A819QAA9_9BILA|nr:unnamed protein product [Adineta steineri]